MDKSFNDEELSDIMKEIEALEQDFKEDVVKTASPVMEELANMSEEEAFPAQAPNVVSLESTRSSPQPTQRSQSQTSMSFKVEGDLNLALNFEIGGKSVALQVSEEGLTIQMEGGVTFTVPVTEKTSLKKAA